MFLVNSRPSSCRVPSIRFPILFPTSLPLSDGIFFFLDNSPRKLSLLFNLILGPLLSFYTDMTLYLIISYFSSVFFFSSYSYHHSIYSFLILGYVHILSLLYFFPFRVFTATKIEGIPFYLP